MGDIVNVNSNIQGDYKRHANGHSKILGMSFDGYPIYGPYGYSDALDASSSVIRMKTAYELSFRFQTECLISLVPSCCCSTILWFIY